MHFKKIFFLKNGHPASFSPAFSRHDGGLEIFLGLKLERDYFFENPRGLHNGTKTARLRISTFALNFAEILYRGVIRHEKSIYHKSFLI